MKSNNDTNNVMAVRFNNKNFISTPYLRDLTKQAIKYLNAGYPVHLRGPSGIGKTMLAMHIASLFDSLAVVVYGNDEYRPSDLIGSEIGYRREQLNDNYVHTVLKTVDDYQKKWQDNQLAIACKNGYILIYDEFARSKPETNNVLLSILEERMLGVSNATGGDNYIRVHPEFKAIFTSNTEDYAGVHKVQDALLDRMITIEMTHMDMETERDIIMGRTDIDYKDADNIVNLLKDIRENGQCHTPPSLRSGIMIGKIIKENDARAVKEDTFFRKVVLNIVGAKMRGRKEQNTRESLMEIEEVINRSIHQHC